MRAAIYTRISLDKSGKRAGVERQHTDAVALCKRRGWKVVGTYEDNDTSAYNGKERPAYARLVSDVVAGKVDVVVAWHSDRLWRNTVEQGTFLAVARESGLRLVATPNQDFDPTDADDAFMSTLLTAVAQKESADKARRIRRAQLAKAERGEWVAGGLAPYGFDRVNGTLRVNKDEAKVVREAVRRVLRGESQRSVVMDYNARGIPTRENTGWRVDTLRDLLKAPRLAGFVEYDGKTYPGTFGSIISVEDHERLAALYSARRRPGRGKGKTVRTHFLTGLLRCSKCGSGMYGTRMRYKDRPEGKDHVARYVCKAPGSGGCGGMTVRAEHAEAAVRDYVFAYLDSAAFRRALRRRAKEAASADGEVSAVADQLTRDRAKLIELGDDYADGEIDRAEYRRLTERLRARITENETALERFTHVAPSAALTEDLAATLPRAWERMTVLERRAVLDALAEGFFVHPARPPVNRFDPARIVPAWRHENVK